VKPLTKEELHESTLQMMFGASEVLEKRHTPAPVVTPTPSLNGNGTGVAAGSKQARKPAENWGTKASGAERSTPRSLTRSASTKRGFFMQQKMKKDMHRRIVSETLNGDGSGSSRSGGSP
jgi:hypothetical protein